MKKIILTTAILICAVIAAKAQAPVTSGDIMSNAEIKFDNLVHDYGNVTQGADGNCEFVFTNTGTEPLVLSNVQSSCGCTVPSWTKEPILPGKTGSIKVNYTKMNIPGPISKQITVFSNAKSGSVVLSIKGTVLEAPKSTTPEKGSSDGSTPLAK